MTATRCALLRSTLFSCLILISFGIPQAWAQGAIAPPKPGYALTFNDEFDGRYLDTGKWSTRFERWNVRSLVGNSEQQIYVDQAMVDRNGQPVNIDPHQVDNGTLTILADRIPDERKASLWGANYTSGMISTEKSHSQQYGYFEMRAKFPAGKGFWQAFWLLPADGGWPPEYDIVEVLGDQPDVVFQYCHPIEDSGGGGDSGNCGGFIRDLIDTTDGFHTYGFEWTATEIVWYVDGQETQRLPNFVFEPMYLLYTPAVGGNWPGSPDTNQQFPVGMEVDYVRVWSRDDTANAGLPSQPSTTAPEPVPAPEPAPPAAIPAPNPALPPQSAPEQERVPAPGDEAFSLPELSATGDTYAISWLPVAGAEHYIVWATNKDGRWSYGPTADSNYTITGLPGRDWCFHVAAHDVDDVQLAESGQTCR